MRRGDSPFLANRQARGTTADVDLVTIRVACPAIRLEPQLGGRRPAPDVVEAQLGDPPGAASATGTPTGRVMRASLVPPSTEMRTVPFGRGRRRTR
jgi:hypothetical protein